MSRETTMEVLKNLALVCMAMIFNSLQLTAQGDAAIEQVARDFLRKKNPELSARFTRFDRITQLGRSVVYEQDNPPAFAIVLRNQGKAEVIGYSTCNRYFPEDIEIFSAPVLDEAVESAVKSPKRLKVSGNHNGSVGPLIRTQWGQGRFFNYYCPPDPLGPNGKVYPGCTAVAMGQILRYYASYNSINFTHAYHSGTYGNLSVNLGPYDWSAMDEVQVAVNLDISDLLYDLGVLLHTIYSISGSSANTHRTLEAFHELGYTGATLLRRSDFSAESWEEEFYANLSEYKPIWIAGGGHSFICDGYDEDGFFHFNLGGCGYGDGYYPIGLVMGYPVSEMITELEPVSWPNPPESVRKATISQETFVTWAMPFESNNKLFRIYVDEQFMAETTDTLFPVRDLQPGIHTIHVSSIGQEGESRWIGPVEIFVSGNLLSVSDASLYAAFAKSLGCSSPDKENLQVSQGDLSRIISLDIEQPLKSLEGIGLCTRLKRLVVSGFPGLGLDAGPLENLHRLQVLEWHEQLTGNADVIGSLSSLTELRFTGTTLNSWEFLRNIPELMKFTYTSAPAPDPTPISDLALLDEINLTGTGLTGAGFLAGKTPLMLVNLADNQLASADFIDKLANLKKIDLSGNLLTGIQLTDGLNSLTEVDLHNNRITSLIITSDLNALTRLDISQNLLTSPGRLFLYTPNLTDLDLSDNRIRGMGTYRCPNLEFLDISGNLLISTDWSALHPGLRYLDLSNNRISDLRGLMSPAPCRKLHYLLLTGNPLSKETYETCLPLLKEAVDSLYYPDHYEPLSPCYPTPADGDRFPGVRTELSWYSGESSVPCVYDLYRLDGDSLIVLKIGLDTCRAVLEGRPSGSFRWAVAARTSDSTYFSGIYEAYPTTLWSVPFAETFESYSASGPIDSQSDYWMVTHQVPGQSDARVVSSSAHSGYQSLEVSGPVNCGLPLEHVNMQVLTLRFSVRIPAGAIGSCRIHNLNGLEVRLDFERNGSGKVYLNEKLSDSYTVEPDVWIDYRLTANARNNQVFLWADTRLVVSQPWLFPAGLVTASSLDFNVIGQDDDTDPQYRLMYIDDVAVQTTGTSGLEEYAEDATGIRVFPNPCAGVFRLIVPESGSFTLSITDISGRKIRSQEIQSDGLSAIEVNVSNLITGYYMIQVNNEKWTGSRSLLLKQ
ncbi:MAG: C10 family peptidase [Bacteroidota bacterium]